jgi:hypothetical protein
MRKLHLLSFFFLTILFAACGTGNKFASSFGKRKYTKGYFVDMPSSVKQPLAISIALQSITQQPNTLTHQSSGQNTLPLVVSKTSAVLQKVETKKTAHLAYGHSIINRIITNAEKSPANKDNTATSNTNLNDDKGEINFYAIAGFVVSTTGVVLTFLSATLTPLCAALLIVGTLLCVYSLFIYRIYFSWLAIIGLSLTIILLALLLL